MNIIPCRHKCQSLLHKCRFLDPLHTGLLWSHSIHSHKKHNLGNPYSLKHTWSSLFLRIHFYIGTDQSVNHTGDWLNQQHCNCRPERENKQSSDITKLFLNGCYNRNCKVNLQLQPHTQKTKKTSNIVKSFYATVKHRFLTEGGDLCFLFTEQIGISLTLYGSVEF